MPLTSSNLKAARDRFSNPAWVCFIWVGLTAGAALLAVTAIFAAEAASRPVSLDIARTLFERLTRVELAFLILLLVVVRTTGQTARWWAVSALLALIMIAQTAWLVPELSGRTDLILGGVEPPPSIAHAAYSISTLVKLSLLLVMGFCALPPRRQSA